MEDNAQIINTILYQVSAIKKKFESIESITGEKFNIFRILKIEKEEVKTHSAILCELLNPKGTHGFSGTFLRLFLESLYREHYGSVFLHRFEGLDADHCNVVPEYQILVENNNEVLGGRLDILIKDNTKNKSIIIENKIYAGDQTKQLVKYNAANRGAAIFYLTLDGKEPSIVSKGDLIKDQDFVCISYERHILEWLEQCRKEAVTHPILRETITQYINLIKYLTNNTMSENLKQEVIDLIIKNKTSFEAAEIVGRVYNEIQELLYEKAFGILSDQWNERFKILMHINGQTDIRLFSFEGYDFFFRLSNESNRLHFDVFPKKPEMSLRLGQANDTAGLIVREFFQKYYSSRIILKNSNYTAWIESHFSVGNLTFDEKISLLDSEGRIRWIENIKNETIELLNSIFSNFKLQPDLKVEYNYSLINYLKNEPTI